MLRYELEASCRLLHYTHGDDNKWHATVESRYPDEEHTDDRTAAMDIRLILNAIQHLSSECKGSIKSVLHEGVQYWIRLLGYFVECILVTDSI